MQLHELKPIHRPKKTKRVGRGGKRGTYSGRGVKGQRSRAGRKLEPLIRQFIKRYPKLRGYRQKLKSKSEKLKTAILNLEILEKKFNSDKIINPKTLFEEKIIHKIKGRLPEVKILGRGDITKPLTIEGCRVSKQAKEKIEKAGGTIKINPKHEIRNPKQIPNSKIQNSKHV